MNEEKSAEAEIKKIDEKSSEYDNGSAPAGEDPEFSKPVETESENENNSKEETKEPVKHSRAKEVFSLIWTFVSTFVVACIVIIAIALVAVKVSGCYIYSVQTGSMSPTYPTGSLVLVKPYNEFEEVEVGDVITYLIDDENNTVTHRVVSIDEENQKLTTQGDANASADASPVLYANVVGKVIFGIPKVGAIVNVVTAEENRNTIIIIIAALLCLSLLSDMVKSVCRNIKKRKQKRKAKRNQ